MPMPDDGSRPLPPTWPGEDVIDEILRQLAEGKTLREIMRSNPQRYPPHATFLSWVVDDVGGLSDRYARARMLCAHSWADDIIEVAREPLIGKRTKRLPDGGIEETIGDNVDRARLIIDAKKWLMARLYPKAYAERMEHGGQIEQVVRFTIRAASAASAASEGVPRREKLVGPEPALEA